MTAVYRFPARTPAAHRFRGFTLVEMMVALGVFGLAMTGVMGLLLRGLDMFYYDTGKLQVNRDIRAFTSELADNAVEANYFLLYPSFTDRTGPLNDKSSGDFLVLVYNNPDNLQQIERLVGYYRAPDTPDGEGPVRKFDLEFTPTNQTPASLLPPISRLDDFPEVLELSRGLSNGRLFCNFEDRSIIVRGEIIRRGTIVRRATNTYNFTVSPRG